MSKLLINESPLQVLPTLAVAIGLNEAIFLQQLHWRLGTSNHEKDGRRWVYDTAEEWSKKFPFWSTPTIRRIINSLRDQKLIITTDQYNKMKIDNTLWYSIDYDQIDALPLITPCDQIDQTARSKRSHALDQIDQANNLENTLRISTKEREEQQPAPTLLNSNQKLPPATATAQRPAIPKITVKAAQAPNPGSAAPLPQWQPVLDMPPTQRDIVADKLNGSANLSPRRNKPTFKSPHVTAALNAAGYVAPGAGSTPVEIYYERFSAYQPDERLSEPQEYDLMTLAGQAGVRPAIEAYGRTGYKPRNVALIIEWTFDPSKYARRGNNNGKNSAGVQPHPDVQGGQSPAVQPLRSIFIEADPGEYGYKGPGA